MKTPDAYRGSQPTSTISATTNNDMLDILLPVLLHPLADSNHVETTSAAATNEQWQRNTARLLRFIGLCWLAYICFLYVLDYVVVSLSPQGQFLPLHFYLLHACPALIVLGLSMSRTIQQRVGPAFLPLVIVCMWVLPFLITMLAAPAVPGPLVGVRGLLSFRFWPITLMGLLLIASNYRLKYVLLLNLVPPVLITVTALLRPPLSSVTIAATVFQTIGFLAISYFTFVLIERLQQQGAALREANEQLRQYAGMLESLTISRERNRVARELHDTLAHTLSALSVQLETTKAYLEIDPKAADALLDTALEVTRSGLQETRRALNALRASPLDDLGLRAALTDLVTSAAETAHVQPDLALPDPFPVLPPLVEQTVYRIAQEAITNVVYHAGARRLGLRFACDNERLMLRIQDDGHGFAPQQHTRPGHFGITGMHERAHFVGGRLDITSAPGAGTTVELTIALDERIE